MKLGDTIAVGLNPIVKTLDSIWGTDLENCQGCKRTQTNLNNAQNIWDFVDAVTDRFRSQPEEKDNASIS